MGRRVDVKSCMLEMRIRSVMNDLKATDNEKFNKLHELLQNIRVTLLAYRDLLDQNEFNLTHARSQSRVLTKPFTFSFPGDTPRASALPQALKLAREALQSSMSTKMLAKVPTKPNNRASTENKRSTASTLTESEDPPAVETAHAVATRLVDEYLRALQKFNNIQCQSLLTSYKNVVRHREVARELAKRRDNDKFGQRVTENANELAVSSINYSISLARVVEPMQELCDKRFVAFKAIRIAFYAAQLRTYDTLTESLVANIGNHSPAEIAAYELRSQRMQEYIAQYVEKFASLTVDSITADHIREFRPAGEDDSLLAQMDMLPRTTSAPLPPPASKTVLPTELPRCLSDSSLSKIKVLFPSPNRPIPHVVPIKTPTVPEASSSSKEEEPISPQPRSLVPEFEEAIKLARREEMIIDEESENEEVVEVVENVEDVLRENEDKTVKKRTPVLVEEYAAEAVPAAEHPADEKSTTIKLDRSNAPRKRLFGNLQFKRRSATLGASEVAATFPKVVVSSPRSVVATSPVETAADNRRDPKRSSSVEMLIRKWEPLKA